MPFPTMWKYEMPAYLTRRNTGTVHHERGRARTHVEVTLNAAILDSDRQPVAAACKKDRVKHEADLVRATCAVELDPIKPRRHTTQRKILHILERQRHDGILDRARHGI